MKTLYELIHKITAPFYTIIYQNSTFFIDYWSFNHIVSGILIMMLLIHRQIRHKLTVLISLLFLWEVTEISFIYFSVGLFRPETIPDQITDIIVGCTGGISVLFIRDKRFRSVLYYNSLEMLICSAMSLLWVGFYGYRYNIPFFNSPVINWFAFLLWSLGLFFTITIYRLINRSRLSAYGNLVLTWCIYIAGLLTVEYIGYYVIGIRQITMESPLIFGLIHGTFILKVYYISAGAVAIMLSNFIIDTKRKAIFSDEQVK